MDIDRLNQSLQTSAKQQAKKTGIMSGNKMWAWGDRYFHQETEPCRRHNLAVTTTENGSAREVGRNQGEHEKECVYPSYIHPLLTNDAPESRDLKQQTQPGSGGTNL